MTESKARNEVREVLAEALAIGQQNQKEKTRHRHAGERLMVRAATNVYTAHLIEAVRPDGFKPTFTGARGKAEVIEAAEAGKPLTAKAYAMLIGYSEAYVSRLYRLGFGIAAGVLNPSEKTENGEKTRWQQVSRQIGDTPEVGAVLGKDVDKLPTVEELDEAILKAQARKKHEREVAATAETSWVPTAPGDQIGMMEELALVVHHGRTLTPKQIERVRNVMDELRVLIEEWVEAQSEGNGKHIHVEVGPKQKARTT